MVAGKMWQRYSPLVILGVIQLVVILLAPSTPGPGSSGVALGTTDGNPLSTDQEGGPAVGDATSATPGGSEGVAAQGGRSVQAGGGLTGSSSPRGVVTSCPGSQPAPYGYMPPCLKFSGSNGGATMTGVTSTTVGFVWVQPVIPANLGAIGTATGLAINEDELCATLKAYTNAVNKRWQAYGRKFVSLDGPGSHSGKANGDTCNYPYFQGSGCAETDPKCWRAEADVVAAMKPALVMAAYNTDASFMDQLSKHKILTVGQGGGAADTRAFTAARAPFVWDHQISLETAGEINSEYFCKKLVGKQVKYAGAEVLNSGSNPGTPPTRKVALLYPRATPDLAGPAAQGFERNVNACGAKVKVLSYAPDPASNQQQMQTVAAQVKEGGYTTLSVAADLLTTINLSNALDSQNWHLEIVIWGIFGTDSDLTQQLTNPRTWKHAFGAAQLRQIHPRDQDCGKAWNDGGGAGDPVAICANIWPWFWFMGDMFQVGGPSPTVTSIHSGMFKMPLIGGDNTRQGKKWGVAGDEYDGGRDIVEVWWCPTRNSPRNGQPGTFVPVLDGKRFQKGQFDDKMRVFPDGPCG